MRIAQLNLLRYGSFTQCKIDFSNQGNDFHLIFGPNEAGKSTALRAVLGLLFGIDPRSTDNFMHENKDLRIGASLCNETNERLDILRRKGNKNTLLSPQEKPFDEKILQAFLGGVNGEQYIATFGLSHKMLIDGGRDMLAGRGELAESLFAASTGLRNIHRLRAQLARSAEELFKVCGSTPKLNQAIGRFREAKKLTESCIQSPTSWQDKNAQLEARHAEQAAALKRRNELSGVLQCQQRILRVGPLIRKRQKLIEQRDALGQFNLIDEETTAERKRVEIEFNNCLKDIDKKARDRTLVEEKLKKIEVAEDMLAKQSEIDSLREGVSGYRGMVRDCNALQLAIAANQANLVELLAELDNPADLAALDSITVDKKQMLRLRDLEKQHIKVSAQLNSAEQQRNDCEREFEQNQQRFQDLPPACDLNALKALHVQIQKRGDLELELAQFERQLAALHSQAQIKLQALRQWQGTLTELAALPVPEEETIERYIDVYEQLKIDRDRQLDINVRIAQQLAQTKQKIDELNRGEPIPSDAQLAKIRQERDIFWKTIRGYWLRKQIPPDRSPQDLADRFTTFIKNADTLADVMRLDTDRNSKLVQLRKELQRIESEQLDCQRQMRTVSNRVLGFKKNWQAVWRPTGLTPLTPKEMSGWLRKQQELCGIAQQLQAYEQQRDALAEEIQDWQDKYRRALRQLHKNEAAEQDSLAMLFDVAEQLLQKMDDDNKNRAAVQNNIDYLQIQRGKLQPLFDAHKEDFAHWQLQWREALVYFGLPDDTAAEQAAVYLNTLEKLLSERSELADKQARYQQINNEQQQYEDAAKDLVDALAQDLQDLPADKVATELAQSFDNAKASKIERKNIQTHLGELEEVYKALIHDEQVIGEELSVLMIAADCEDLDELKQLEKKSRETHDLNKTIANLDLQLSAEAVSMQTLLEEVHTSNIDKLRDEMNATQHELEQINTALATTLQQIGALGEELNQFDGRVDAARAREQEQYVLTEIDRYTRQYALCKLSMLILTQELTHYSEKNQGPLVYRAGQIFQQITLGRFKGIVTAVGDDHQAKLYCLRDNGQNLAVEALSDGTRDQLYLALRVASIEQHVQRNAPLPVVIDDALINFDDDRSSATLQVFQELAKQTQVLFFTHHTKMLELATQHLAADAFQAHDLISLRGAQHAPDLVVL